MQLTLTDRYKRPNTLSLSHSLKSSPYLSLSHPMSLFLLRTPAAITTVSISYSSSKPPYKKPQQQQFPLARDRVIDFGRHKGRPLGSLPSTYLKWVSKNLRARDFQHWAELADQVLHDSVYNDRIEWELAENLLTGNMNINSFASSSTGNGSDHESAAARLVEMSERFGWDNDDKVGWSKVVFQLLGTSNGGRIPRKVEGKMGKEELTMVDEKKRKEKRRESSESEERRRERRMRRVRDKMGIRGNSWGTFGNGEDDRHDGDGDHDDSQDWTLEIKNKFPGREALLNKVLRSKRFL
ncbi:hypothetical protein Ddye_013054 [Dipteronia dyeriana]|uniref:Golgin family A protein n=1 Tax=Dipteronia dyeriana TaxID=168575 RepID=A0AAD9X5V4_9ROSI|nr:hypothetical protein Ddye_013054 [Dipteronia dyeriana]